MVSVARREPMPIALRPNSALRLVTHGTAGAALVASFAAMHPAGPPSVDSRALATTGRIAGSVYDSVAAKPLAGAEVHVMGDEGRRLYNATTDARGLFRIDSIEPGTYVAGFFHPRLDSLGIEGLAVSVAVGGEGDTRLALAIPSRGTIVATYCPQNRAEAGTLLLGRVLEARGAAPLAGARVSLAWSELRIGSGGMFADRISVVAESADDGRFAVCGIPSDAVLLVQATNASDTSGVVLVHASDEGITGVEMFVGPSESIRTDSLPADAAAGVLLPRRGSARLVGTVRSRAGAPIPGAHVRVVGSTSEITTTADGSFHLENLPAGSYTLEARAIGFEPERRAVALLVGGTATNRTELVLEPYRPSLDTIRVIGSVDMTLSRTGFDARRKSGSGHFIDRDAIARRNPMFITDMIAHISGVTVNTAFGGHYVLMKTSGEYCMPDLFIDGVRHSGREVGRDIDQLIDPTRVAWIEVYTRPNEAPLQFAGTTTAGCGSIVVWNYSGARAPVRPRSK
jgi:hypothetical protein